MRETYITACYLNVIVYYCFNSQLLYYEIYQSTETKVNKRRTVENDTQIILVWNFLFIVHDQCVKENKFFFKNVCQPAQAVAYLGHFAESV